MNNAWHLQGVVMYIEKMFRSIIKHPKVSLKAYFSK